MGVAMRKKQARLEQARSYGDFPTAITNPFTVGAATVTTEIKIISEPRENLTKLSSSDEEYALRSQPTQGFPPPAIAPYSINIDSTMNGSGPAAVMDEQSLIKQSHDAVQGYAWVSFLFFLALIVTWV